MPFEILTLHYNPVTDSFHTDELNKFCINKKIIHRETAFFTRENTPCWTIFLEYEPILEQVKPQKIELNEEELACYNRLRQWRMETAEKEGIPPFIIAHNRQLEAIIKNRIITIESLKNIKGFNSKKSTKYGTDIIKIVADFFEMEKANKKHDR